MSMSWTDRILTEQAAREENNIMFPRFEGNVGYKKLKKKFEKNYFGLPIYALGETYEGLVYQSRKTLENPDTEDAENIREIEDEKESRHSGRVHVVDDMDGSGNETNRASQRKVAKALLTMCSNPHMAVHFIYKGGVEAIFKMIAESNDIDVLTTCAACLACASESAETCLVLIEKNVIANINTLIENGDDKARMYCAIVLAHLTYQEGQEEAILSKGILLAVQSLLNSTETPAIISYCLLCVTNFAIAMTGPDAEAAVRILNQTVKRLEILRDIEAAVFVGEVFNCFAKIAHYSGLLVEEGVLAWLVAMLEAYQAPEVFDKCMESFFYLSQSKKNRREMVSSGIHHHFPKLFTYGSTDTRSYCLLMIGNLLSADLYHEKVARDDIVSLMLEMLDPSHPKQFTAASYCICHLAQVAYSADVLVRNDVIGVILRLLPHSPNRDANGYMWTLLVNLSNNHEYFVLMIREENLVPEIYKEASAEEGDLHVALSQLSINLSNKTDLSDLLDLDKIGLLVKSCKSIFSTADHHKDVCNVIRTTILTALNNLAVNVPSCRGDILSNDLIRLFEQSGFEDKNLNLKYAALLNIISNEESCCLKLLENGVQRLLMTLQDKFNNEHDGKDVTASILHNMSLKRGTMSSGVLPTLLQNVKNCKGNRVLWSVRAIANFSCHSKSRLQLTKEKKLIPILNGIMRYGCMQADRVQHYCAIAICNILSTKVEKEILEYLIKSGGVVDLVVVTLLRVNSGTTKEYLGKALFNLLCRSEFRSRLIEVDVLEALTELGKIDNLELLELCVRSVYNISCEIQKFGEKLLELRLVDMLCARAAGSPLIAGYKANNNVKLVCGKALANMSFNSNLALSIAVCENTADALHSINNIQTEEAIYTISVTCFNVSFLSKCTSLADTSVVPILVNILKGGSVLCVQLCVAALCNFSIYKVYHQQLTASAIAPLIQHILLAASMDISVKLDVLKFLYNVVCFYPAARSVAIEADAVVALGKLLKLNSDESTIRFIGRIMKELCLETMHYKKLLNDGSMNILLKLSKIEKALLKLDLSCAFYSLTTVPDTMKIIKWDGIDILFWLTLHDCLTLYDPIRKHCGKALRNLTVNNEEAKNLVKEERFGTVLKTLVKSRNEDVLWEAAGIVYNLMSIPECRQVMLQRNAIPLLFEIASSGYISVRHICSACLHMVPDNMPNMEDPEVLQLVLCLLEVETGDQFAALGVKCVDALEDVKIDNSWEGAVISPCGTSFSHMTTNYEASWLTLPSEVDRLFTPVVVNLTFEGSIHLSTKSLQQGALTFDHLQRKIKAAEFNDFVEIGKKLKSRELSIEYVDRDEISRQSSSGDRNAGAMSGGQTSSNASFHNISKASSAHRGDFDENLDYLTTNIDVSLNPPTPMGQRSPPPPAHAPILPSSVVFPKIHGAASSKKNNNSQGGRGLPTNTLQTLKSNIYKENNKTQKIEADIHRKHSSEALYQSTSGLNYTSTNYGDIPDSLVQSSSPLAKYQKKGKKLALQHGDNAAFMDQSIGRQANLLSIGGNSSTSAAQLQIGKAIHDAFPSAPNSVSSAEPRLVQSHNFKNDLNRSDSFSSKTGSRKSRRK